MQLVWGLAFDLRPVVEFPLDSRFHALDVRAKFA